MQKSEKQEASVEEAMPTMANPMMAVNPAVASAWIGVFAEGTRFLAHRLRKDLETQKAILQCKSATDLLEVQTRFYETAIQEYAAEVMRFSEMVMRAAEETAEDGTKPIVPTCIKKLLLYQSQKKL